MPTRKTSLIQKSLLILLAALTLSLTVTACNGGGGGSGGSSGEVPSTPTDLALVAGDGEITARWSKVDGATSYTLYYKEGADFSDSKAQGVKSQAVSDGATTNAVLSGLTNNTEHYVRITATNATGESELSDAQTATPQSSSPQFGELISTKTINTSDASGTVEYYGFLDNGQAILHGFDTLEVWNLITATLIKKLPVRRTSAAYSPDGSLIVTPSDGGDKTMQLYNASSYAKLADVTTDSNDSLAINPDNSRLATYVPDHPGGSLVIWNISDTTNITVNTSVDLGNKIIGSLQFNNDGTKLAHKYGNSIVIRETTDYSTGISWDVAGLYAFTYNHDGTKIASDAGGGSDIKIWNAKNGQPIATLKGHTDFINVLVYNSDGSLLASASDDKTVIVWDTSTNKALITLKGHTKALDDVSFISENRLISTSKDANGNEEIKIWSMAR